MKLELGFVQINDIQSASESKMESGTIYVNTGELKALLLEDENLKSVEFGITKPGESVRVMSVGDVIEPRVKVNEGENLFPGVISKVETVGSGRTSVLKGSAVATTGKIVDLQEGIIDMYGEGAKYTPSSQLNNLVAICEPIDGFIEHAHERAARFVGLKAADYINKLARDAEPDEVKVHETCSVKEGVEKYPELPRVAYVLMSQDQGLMHDTYIYDVGMKQSLPTTLSPTELVDGAVLNGSCVSTYDKNTIHHHLNNPVVADLFEQHGEALNFVSVIITNENAYLADKVHSSDWTSKSCEFLGVDGAIVSQEGFGSPGTNLIMSYRKTEGKGAKTVIIAGEYAGRDGAPQSLTNADVNINAVVTSGNANMIINLPTTGKIIGYPKVADIIAGGFGGSPHEDGSIVAEPQIITEAVDEMGPNRLSAR